MPKCESQYSASTDELFGLLFSVEKGTEHLAMMYYAYIDDSADRRREQVIVAGAVIGQKEKWSFLNKAWKARLKQDDIDYFKSSHCETLNGQFHKFRASRDGKQKALRIRDDLDKIIHQANLSSLGVTLSVPTHAMMLADPAKFGSIPEVPYRLAFQQVIAECAKTMQLVGRGNVVTFGHDDGDDFDALRSIYREFKKRNPCYRGILHDFVPLDDKTHPEVQAADVAAYVTLGFAKRQMEDPSPENMKRLTENMYKVVNWLDSPVPFENMDSAQAPARAVFVP